MESHSRLVQRLETKLTAVTILTRSDDFRNPFRFVLPTQIGPNATYRYRERRDSKETGKQCELHREIYLVLNKML
jgi:hypothetical protein